MHNPYNDDDYYIVHPEKKHITRRISSKDAGVKYGTTAAQSPSIKHALDYANKKHGEGHVAKTGRELFHSQNGSSERMYKPITEDTMKEYVNQAPFSFGKEMYEGFTPVTASTAQVITESNDKDEDDTPRSKGNAFDWKGMVAKKKEDSLRNHDKVKTDTGTVYKRKEDAKGADTTDTKPEEKRGRGRPAGKYGSYKKRIAEALANFGVEQIDEISKSTLTSYKKGAKEERAERNSATKRIKAMLDKKTVD